MNGRAARAVRCLRESRPPPRVSAPADDHHRHQRQRQDERGAQRRHHAQREVAEERRREPAHEHDRPEHEQRGERPRDQGPATSSRRGARPRCARHPFFPVPGRRFRHHDRVVHQHADAQRQPAEREDVDGDVEQLEHDERDQHRERHHRGRWRTSLGDHAGRAGSRERERAAGHDLLHQVARARVHEAGLRRDDGDREASGNSLASEATAASMFRVTATVLEPASL